MKEIGIILNILINYFPSTFLRIWPNMNKLRVKKPILIGIYLVFFATIATVFILVQGRIVMDFRAIQLFKMAFGVVGLLLPFAFIRDNPFKTLSLYFIVALYQTVVIRMANHIDVRYWGSTLQDTSFWSNTLTLIALDAMTLPFMTMFIKRVIRPIMDSKFYTKIWRFFWLVPVSLYGVLIIDSLGRGFSLEYVGSNWFSFMNLLIIGGMFAVYFIMANMLKQAAENATFKENTRMTESLLTMQREQYARLTESMEQTTAARHDIRHQFAVMKSYLGKEDWHGALQYCDKLAGSIPVSNEQTLCDNFAVNAVAHHYLAIAGREGIAIDIRLDIPAKSGGVSDMDLCVVMGNLLENAVEACRRMERGDKYIRVRSVVDGEYLSLIVENSFDGLWNEQDGKYFSRKHGEGESLREGVGLSSIKAVCAKYDGLAKFEVTGNVWKSSVLVTMRENTTG